MKIVIEQSLTIKGAITAPSSKSITQRAFAAALLHNGRSIVTHTGTSDDELAALNVIQQLGAKIISNDDDTLILESNGINPVSAAVDCGESGLAARLFTPIAAISGSSITITGKGSLLKRPMEGFADSLPQMGVQMHDFTGYLPVSIQGPLISRSIKADGSSSSQFISGLLFALAHTATEPVNISVSKLKSRPYIDLTLDVLERCGRPVKNIFYREFIIDPSRFSIPPTLTLSIEGDWSSGAYFLVAGAIAGEVTVRNLDAGSKQADKTILDVLQQTGAQVNVADNGITIKTGTLQAFEFDATDCPDLFPILAVLAACCNGESSIKGLHRLFYKESNRVESVTEMLFDFGVPFSAENDTLYITGVPYLQGTVIDTYSDHRIAMAAAIGALRARGPVDIADAEVVNKSYPAFFDHLLQIGGRCGLKPSYE